MKRIYLVDYKFTDDEGMVLIVAESHGQAKALAYSIDYMSEGEFIDLRSSLIKKQVDVSKDQLGEIDAEWCLKKGVIEYLGNTECEICGMEPWLVHYNGKNIICDDCEEVDK